MPKYDSKNLIRFGIRFDTDKSSLLGVKKSLQEIQNIKPANFSGTEELLTHIKQRASLVLSALTKAFNIKLNTLNVLQFYKELGIVDRNLDLVYEDLSKLGGQGRAAFNSLASSLTTTNTQLRESAGLLQTMGTTMMNTVKWGIASSIMNGFTNSVSQAFQYVKSLDSALTDIRIVTGDSRELMAKFADQANRAAQELGRSTMEYSKAALTYYQQGLSDLDVQARTEATLKAQNITGAGSLMADYLTAVWNGYKVANEEAELYVDKLAAVADSSASNMSLLAVAMSKVASTANMLGVPVDSLNAQIATIVATTRQAPESVGNALKTIYARINDIATGADDAEISLGNYTSKMAELGVNVLDSNGKLRDTGDVIELIGGKWLTLSREQQIYLARTMAGQRQYNNLLALFENWGKYTDLVNVSMESQGTTMEKNSRYMESLEAHLNQLGAASERVKSAMIDSDSFKGLIDIGITLTTVFANFIESIGGGGNALLALGSIATQVFSGVISKEIGNAIIQARTNKQIYLEMNQAMSLTQNQINSAAYKDPNNEAYREYIDNLKLVHASWSVLSQDERQDQEKRIEKIRLLSEEKAALQENALVAKNFVKDLNGMSLDKTGFTQGLAEQLKLNVIPALDQCKYSHEQFITSLDTGSEPDYLKYYINDLQLLANTLGPNARGELENYMEKLKNLGDNGDFTSQKFQELDNTISNFRNKINTGILSASSLEQDKKRVQEINQELEKTNIEVQTVNEQSMVTFNIQRVVKFAGAIGQIASITNSVVSLFRVWKNENTSLGEKLLQTFTNIGFLVPMILSAFNSLKVALGIDVVLGQKRVLQERLITLEKEKQLALEAAQNKSHGAESALTFILELIKGVKTQMLGLPGIAQTAGQSITGAFSKMGTAISGAMAKTAFSLGGIAVSVGTVVAAIGIAIGVAVAVYKVWNRAKDAAAEAAKQAELARKIYTETNAQLKELNSSWQNLQSAQDNLKNLANGTQEWKDALQDVNTQVLLLIQNFPELQQYLTTTSDGMLTFRDGAKEAVTSAYQQRNQVAGYTYIAAEQKRNDAQNNYLIQEASREVGLGSWSNDTLTKLMDAVHQHGEYILGDRDALENLAHLNRNQIEKVLDNTDKLSALAGKLEANITATENLTTSIIKSGLEGIDLYLNSSNKDVFAALVDQRITNAPLNESKYTIYDDSGQRDNESALKKRYAEIEGIEEADLKFTGIFHRVLQRKKENGEWEKVYTILNVKTAIATADAMEQADEAYKEIDDIMKLFEQTFSGDVLNSAYLILKAGNDLNKISSGSMSQKSILKLQNNVEQLSNLTGISSDKLSLTLDQLYKDAGVNFLHFTLNLSPLLKDAFKEMEINSEDYSTLAASAIAEMLRKGIEKGGAEGFDVMKVLLDNIDSSDVTSFLNLLNSIDFSDLDLDTFRDYLELAEILLGELFNPLLQQLIDILKEIENINPEEFYKSIHDVIDGLKTGDKIDAEKAQILQDAGVDLDLFFEKMMDGSWKLRAESELFSNYMENFTLQPFLDKIELAQNRKTQFQNIEAQGENITKSASWKDDHDHVHYDGELLDTQIHALDLIGAKTELITEILIKRQKGLAIFPSLLEAIQAEVEKHKLQLLDLDGLWQKEDEAIKQYQLQIINTKILGINTISELNDALMSGELGEGLLGIEKFNLALKEVSDRQMEDLGFDVDEYENLVSILKATNLEMKDNEYLARAMAKAHMRVSKGMDDLIENFDLWSDSLLDFQENGDFSGLVENWGLIKLAMANLFDSDELSIDMLGPDFIANNLDKIQAVKDGVDGAYEELDALMDQQLILNAYGVSDFSQLDQDIQDAYNKINLVSNDATILIGAVFSGEDLLLNAFQNIADGANWTSLQAQAAFADMGYDVEVLAKDPQKHQDNEETQYYVPPTYRMVPKEWDFGPFGSGTMMMPELATEGHYASAGGGIKETYEPGEYAIKTVTKNGKGSGGNISRSKARSSAPRTSSGGKGGGGGGKGSTKTPTPAKRQKAKLPTQQKEYIKNPYQDVLKQYDLQLLQLKRLSKVEKSLNGKDRLDNLKKQTDLLLTQNNLLDKRYKISNDKNELGSTAWYAKQLMNDSVLKKTGKIFDKSEIPGLDFGLLANKSALLAATTSAYNTAVAAADKARDKVILNYNKAMEDYDTLMKAGKEEEAKTFKDKWDAQLEEAETAHKHATDAAKTLYDKRMNNIKNYEKALLEDKKWYENFVERVDLIAQKTIEQTTYTLKLKLDAGDAERDYLDFENKVIKKLNKDDIFGNAQASFKELTSYINSGLIAGADLAIKSFQDRIDKIKKANGGYTAALGISESDWNKLNSKDREALTASVLGQVELELKNANETQKKNLKKIQDKIEEIKEDYLDAIDDVNDKMNSQIDQYERVNELIDHSIKLTLLLYGDKGYETLNKYYSIQEENNKKELESLAKQQDYWQQQMNNLVVGSDAWKKFKENLDEVTDKLNNKVVEMMENAAKIFENRVSAAVDKINNKMTGGLGLDYVDEQWDYMNNYDDYFLDTFNTKTGIDEVTRVYQDALSDAAGNPKSYQRINNLMQDQLKILREKDKLTQYDLDRAKSLLDVEKARMALEDARNNKTKMRLRRDSQGNYTYQYVADEEKLDDLQKALADAQNNLYNQDKLHYKLNLNKLYDTYKDYIQKMKLLTEEYNATQDEEERARIQKRIDLLNLSTSKMMEGLNDDNKYNLQYLTQSFADGMGIDLSKYSPEEQMELLKENVPFVASLIQTLNDRIVGSGGLLPATKDYVTELNSAIVQYDKDVDDILNKADTSVAKITLVTDEYGNVLNSNIESASKLVQSNEDLIKSCENLLTSMQKMLSAVDQYVNKAINYQELIKTIQDAQDTEFDYLGSGLSVDRDVKLLSNELDTTKGNNVELTGTKTLRIKQALDLINSADYNLFMTDSITTAWKNNNIKASTQKEFEGIIDTIVKSNFDPTVIMDSIKRITNDNLLSRVLNTVGQDAYNIVQNTTDSNLSEKYITINANFPDATSAEEINLAFRNIFAMAAMSASSKRD